MRKWEMRIIEPDPVMLHLRLLGEQLSYIVKISSTSNAARMESNCSQSVVVIDLIEGEKCERSGVESAATVRSLNSTPRRIRYQRYKLAERWRCPLIPLCCDHRKVRWYTIRATYQFLFHRYG